MQLSVWALDCDVLFVTLTPHPDLTNEQQSPRHAHGIAAVVRDVYALLRQPGAAWDVAFIATYKLGEALTDSLWLPFLVDAGMATADVGLYEGVFGLAASIAGSVLGGVLVARWTLLPSLTVVSVVRGCARDRFVCVVCVLGCVCALCSVRSACA